MTVKLLAVDRRSNSSFCRYYIVEVFELQTFRTQDLSFPRMKGPYGELSFPRNESSRNFRSRDLSFPGTFVPGELSFLGPFIPRNFRSHYSIGLVAALLCVLNYCMFGCDFTLDKHYFYFCARIANIWNSLPNHVVDVNSVNVFKARLDRFWMDQDVKFDFTADLTGIADRSVNVITET